MAAYDHLYLATTVASRLQVSTNGGSSWTPLGTDVTAGVDLGAFTAGQRKAITLRVYIPAGTSARLEELELILGEGI